MPKQSQAQRRRAETELIRRMEKTNREVSMWLDPATVQKLIDFVNEADLEKHTLSEDELMIMAGINAMTIRTVLDEEFNKLRLLIRAVYVMGVQRGLREATSEGAEL